ncbi:unnamed protein product [Clonostachys byssicola]|uniref:Uncharacterized protein n=1 Tax=Clonostachys byssicola TaxID=160290 RepID=A0A9N9UC26_9HYPO|nr:unnamed protein product [Clonostachys byssicola]
MADDRAHFKCASSIALLEGRASLELPGDIISASTLGALDIRLRRVEEFYNVALPPACQTPAWDTLAYRIFRLIKAYRTFPPPMTGGMFTSKHFLELVPDPSNVSSETLQTLCSDLGYRSYNWTKSLLANPSHELGVYSQICCYYAGKSKQVRLVAIPATRADIYGLLAVLSVENGPAIKQPMSSPMPIPPPFGKGLPPGVTVVNATPSRKRKTRRRSILSKFSWMKKLAFWRKRRSDDDSSIYSSSSSGSSSSSTIS